jgi:hypothetical protein
MTALKKGFSATSCGYPKAKMQSIFELEKLFLILFILLYILQTNK